MALPSAAEEAVQPGQLQAARDAYCEAIFTGRLYGQLQAASQRMLSRAAVYGVAVTLEGLAAAAGAELEAARVAAAGWRSAALIHSDAGRSPELWTVYGRRCHIAVPGARSVGASGIVRPLRLRSATWPSPRRGACDAFGLT